MSNSYIDIFISYSSKNSQLAYRFYGDIVKFGGVAYLYEKQSDLIPFPEEIFQKINDARAFCLIDSRAARESNWVHKECEYALKDKGIYKRNLFFVILAEPLGDWRQETSVFQKINTIRVLDFSLSNYQTELQKRFDVKDYYYESVKSICEKLDIHYTPPVPGNHDFQNELNLNNWKGEGVEALQKDLESIIIKKKLDFSDLEQRLKLLIDDCHQLDIKVITPSLILGSFYFEVQMNQQALKLFELLSVDFPKDPRSWLWLSQSAFRLNKYETALNALLHSERLVSENIDNPHIAKYEQEVIYNKIKLLVILGSFKEAQHHILQLNSSLMILPEFKVLHLLLYTKLGEFATKKNLETYKNMLIFYDQNPISINEQMLMAELEHEIAKYFFHQDHLLNAIEHYNNAIFFADKNIQLKAELVLIYKILGINHLEICTSIFYHYQEYIPTSLYEAYYLGLILYLKGDKRKAKKYYKSSITLGFTNYKNLLPQKNFISSLLRR